MYTAPLRFTNAHEAEDSFIKDGRRYKQIAKRFAEIVKLWEALASQYTGGTVSIESLNVAGTGFAGTVFGQPFEADISPALTSDGVISKLRITKRGTDNNTTVCAAYLYSLHSDVLLSNGRVLIEKDNENLEFLWLCHLAEAVIAEVNCS